MNPLIRRALASDVEVLIDLTRRTITASYRPFLGDAAVGAFLSSGAVEQYVAENLGVCSVLERDGRVVGYAVCRDNLVDLMMVDHVCHRQGLGTQLLRHAEELLGQRHGELRLESFEANQVANAFYRKNGWVEVRKFYDKVSAAAKVVFQKVTGPSQPCN